MKKECKVYKSHFSVFMYVYISLRSVFGSASTGHNRQVCQIQEHQGIVQTLANIWLISDLTQYRH